MLFSLTRFAASSKVFKSSERRQPHATFSWQRHSRWCQIELGRIAQPIKADVLNTPGFALVPRGGVAVSLVARGELATDTEAGCFPLSDNEREVLDGEIQRPTLSLGQRHH